VCLANAQSFNWFIVAAILVNTVVLSLEHDGMSDEFDDWLSKVNTWFALLFMVEMVLKILGMTLMGFVRLRLHSTPQPPLMMQSDVCV